MHPPSNQLPQSQDTKGNVNAHEYELQPTRPTVNQPRQNPCHLGWSFRKALTPIASTAHTIFHVGYQWARSTCRKIWTRVISIRNIRKIVGPADNNKPHNYTALGSLLVFLIFIICATLAMKYPLKGVYYTFMILGGSIYTIAVIVVIADFAARKSTRSYRRNLSNTIITVLLAIPVMTVLYARIWYSALNQVVLQTSIDTVAAPYFPAVAIFQEYIWSSQGSLVEGHSKCFLGWWTNDDPLCSSWTLEQQLLGGSCNCNQSWSNIIEDFDWWRNSYRYFSFTNPNLLVAPNETYTMILQVGFDYNLTKARLDSSAYQNPSLWLAVYDPTLTLIEALQQGYSRLMMINGNAQHHINIGLKYRQKLHSTPAYDYGMFFMWIPSPHWQIC